MPCHVFRDRADYKEIHSFSYSQTLRSVGLGYAGNYIYQNFSSTTVESENRLGRDTLLSTIVSMGSDLLPVSRIEAYADSALVRIGNVVQADLHGFSDASNVAYAAVVYLKVVSASGRITISLMAGKSRVAPVTPLSVPRFELSTVVLLSRLMEFVFQSVGSMPYHCWTNSTIVLDWVK